MEQERRAEKNHPAHHLVTREWLYQAMFFLVFYISIFAALTYFKQAFFDGVIPWADAFASATAFTAMWLMTRKKVESWLWWIATNVASVPLYFVKHYVFTSVYFLVLLIFAFWGFAEWRRKAKLQAQLNNPSF
jgi:nicotinamide mononucleotide transporter